MAHDRNDDVLMYVTLNAETKAHYARRGKSANRTVEEQLRYELEVYLGLTLPDPGDCEATQRRQLFRRMSTGRVLQG